MLTDVAKVPDNACAIYVTQRYFISQVGQGGRLGGSIIETGRKKEEKVTFIYTFPFLERLYLTDMFSLTNAIDI